MFADCGGCVVAEMTDGPRSGGESCFRRIDVGGERDGVVTMSPTREHSSAVRTTVSRIVRAVSSYPQTGENYCQTDGMYEIWLIGIALDVAIELEIGNTRDWYGARDLSVQYQANLILT